ncbi:cysteine-rich receptor-like protein kinase 6 [Pistacia vera]|uniref:cysteine-rich receptor-like protein kinase 6 n=1 Tax=Pistacia vera TaxID=55513 RepID=UPI0012639F4C|nr:cysteine-rich receptor-like protein kinase 6 [Pistacia vera]
MGSKIKIMASSRLCFFLSLYFIYYFDLTIADELESLHHDCYVNNGNYTTNSTYHVNLNHLLNSLSNTTPIANGFYHSSYGENPDKVYGSAICRPDMDPDSCRDSEPDISLKCGHGSEAAAGGSNKYAAGKEAVSDTVTLYGLVQCTPDLTESKCNECLIDTIKFMQNCCDTRQGGRVITPSCSFRYETNEFYKSSIAGPPVSSPTPSTSPTTQKGL